jgi:hypothetical protein
LGDVAEAVASTRSDHAAEHVLVHRIEVSDASKTPGKR